MAAMLLDRPERQQQDRCVAVKSLDLRNTQFLPTHAVGSRY
jgi:hypothetical protein